MEETIKEKQTPKDNEEQVTTVDGKELKAQSYISPTSINTYFTCPRQYYYRYILKMKSPPTDALVKGIICHTVIERFFDKYEKDFEERIFNIFNKTWESQSQKIKDLEVTPEKESEMKQDCINMIGNYLEMFKRQLKTMLDIGAIMNDSHGFYLLKPKFRELKVSSEEYHVRGFIDRVNKDFNGNITIGDYKTSKKYGMGFPESYKRQLAIYGLLYQLQEGVKPDMVAIDFLRYGETYFLACTPSLMKFARDTLNYAYEKTRSLNIEDYELNESKLCAWCSEAEICNGRAAEAKKKRLDKMKQIAEETN